MARSLERSDDVLVRHATRLCGRVSRRRFRILADRDANVRRLFVERDVAHSAASKRAPHPVGAPSEPGFTRLAAVAEYLSVGAPPADGFFARNFSAAGGRMYFTDENARRIDAARTTLHEWRQRGSASRTTRSTSCWPRSSKRPIASRTQLASTRRTSRVATECPTSVHGGCRHTDHVAPAMRRASGRRGTRCECSGLHRPPVRRSTVQHTTVRRLLPRSRADRARLVRRRRRAAREDWSHCRRGAAKRVVLTTRGTGCAPRACSPRQARDTFS